MPVTQTEQENKQVTGPFQIRKILFPTDFSKSSEVVANHALGIAHATQAEVWLLHVVPWLAAWHGASEAHFDVLADDLGRKLHESQTSAEAASVRLLERFQKQHFGSASTHTCVRSGGVAESIVEYANEIDADLIMMPTKGWGPVRRFLIGSIAAKVLHDARCSVWTSPHVRELEPFQPYRHILCATDYRVLTPQLPVRSAQIAQLFNSRLSVVSAIHSPAVTTPAGPERPSVQAIRRDTIETIKGVLSKSHIAASVHVVEGMEGEVVRHVAILQEADLIVIGQGHLEEPMGHLRTHAYEIIWNAPCPVLILPATLLK
jgi:nucleotide-binding universal stress UspA family protein